MKKRHNKKRNTVFLFEVLVRELTKSIVDQNINRSDTIKEILKTHFNANSALGTELDCFKSLCETSELDLYTAEKLIFTAKRAHQTISSKQIFNEQSSVIKKINSNLGAQVYNNFVPNYKSIATVSQLFGADSTAVGIKRGVLLEQQVLETLTANTIRESKTEMKPIDNIVFKTFTSKFNETYGDDLLSEQKELLNRYILSFSSDTDMKIYLNEELGRLHTALHQALVTDEIKSDEAMAESTNSVIAMIEKFRDTPVDKNLVEKVLKIQNLVHEITA